MIQTCFAGCDISSRWLDLCILGADAPRPARYDNTPDGIADLPELGRLRGTEIAALAGVAPHAPHSGARRGTCFISGGGKPLRDAMFMAATSAALCPKSHFADHYTHLREGRKTHKRALIAIVTKMLVTINAMLRENQNFHIS